MPSDIFQRYSLLYIEDDDGVRSINARFLKRMFKNFYEACDGEEGFLLYQQYQPDIILTDIKMPKLDGLSLAKKIRLEDENVRIIISTAFSEQKYLLDAVELGLERYLIKPLNKRNLLPALEKAVQSIEKNKPIKQELFKNFFYDKEAGLFFLGENVLALNKKELLFLRLLVENPSRIIGYDEIEHVVWEDEFMSLNSLRTTIGFLRKKLPCKCIKNISNMGYTFSVE